MIPTLPRASRVSGSILCRLGGETGSFSCLGLLTTTRGCVDAKPEEPGIELRPMSTFREPDLLLPDYDQAKVPKCPECSAPHKDWAKFCELCGHKIERAEEVLSPDGPETESATRLLPSAHGTEDESSALAQFDSHLDAIKDALVVRTSDVATLPALGLVHTLMTSEGSAH